MLSCDAVALAEDLRNGKISPLTLVQQALERSGQVQVAFNAFTAIRRKEALLAAEAAEMALKRGDPVGPLCGVPVAVKETTAVAGDLWTEGSWIFANRVAGHDATVVSSLKQAGAILLARTASPEFAWAGTTQSPLWGVTRNPLDPARTPGGSSGGAGVAVATGCVPIAEGSDMGGSIRIPASCCGVYGFKPSQGRIPFTAVPVLKDPLSHWGPLARSVRDVALFMDVAQGGGDWGYDTPPPVAFREQLALRDIGTIRVGVSVDLGCYAVAPDIEAAFETAVEAFARAGAEVREVFPDLPPEMVNVWDREWDVWQAFVHGEEVRGREQELDPSVRRIIAAGKRVSAVQYREGETIRLEMWKNIRDIFRVCDVFVCPTLALDVPFIDGPYPAENGVPDGRLHEVTMTGPFNLLARLPVLSVPVGQSASGMPVGMQIVGRPGDDLTVLQVAHMMEQAGVVWRGACDQKI